MKVQYEGLHQILVIGVGNVAVAFAVRIGLNPEGSQATGTLWPRSGVEGGRWKVTKRDSAVGFWLN